MGAPTFVYPGKYFAMCRRHRDQKLCGVYRLLSGQVAAVEAGYV